VLRKALRRIHKDQGGFTLIEVLVVMTILGILAAIVSISLLGVTASARTKAKDAEKQTVQAAFDAMLADQQVGNGGITGANCDGSSHNDMTNWPKGVPYSDPNKVGWTPGLVTVLATHYLREPATTYGYSCNATGDITQTATPMDKANPK
jgi:prepilin-type N-terminal cleavage/methylation domain-containing protein